MLWVYDAVQKEDTFALSYILLNSEFNYAFTLACKWGKFRLARWLDEQYEFNIDFQVVFEHTCIAGKLNIAKWLYERHFVKITEDIFISVVQGGYIDMVEWMAPYVDIHYDKDMAFCVACFKGRLDIAQLLYSYGGVNVLSQKCYAFRTACKKGYLDIVKWLYSKQNVLVYSIKSVDGIPKHILRWLVRSGAELDIPYARVYKEYLEKMINRIIHS